MTQQPGSPMLVLLAWLAAGLLSLAGALAYAEPGAMFPEGGNVCCSFISDALVKRFGFKWGRRSVGPGGAACATLCIVAAILTTNKFATLLFPGLVYAGITLQQTVLVTAITDIGRKHVGTIPGASTAAGSVGGFLFSVSYGYFVKWFGSYDLALLPVALMLTVGTLAWLRVDATEELIPERLPVTVPETAVPAVS